MAVVDLIAIGVIVLLALRGFRRGLVTGVLSLAGLVVGALAGARLAEALLGGSATRYLPLLALFGAMTLAGVGQALGTAGGRSLRQILRIPPLRALDNVGGLALGAVTGVALCWAVGAVLLYVPGETELRRYAQESTILSTLNREIPPEDVLGALARFDALGTIAGPAANVPAPDARVLRDSDVTVARESVVRVRGNACGLGIEGSGWVAGRGLVVTNAHVVAGVDEPAVDFGRGEPLRARVVAFDGANDVAVLSVPGLRALVLQMAPAERGAAAALLGYPENGPYTATAVRVGRTSSIVGRDAYGRFPTLRRVTSLRGTVRQGNSGGPVVDAQGRVVATVFGGRVGAGRPGGYGVPNELVAKALRTARSGTPLETPCVSH
jgi:S1-C subfamily serine protease